MNIDVGICQTTEIGQYSPQVINSIKHLFFLLKCFEFNFYYHENSDTFVLKL